MHEAPVQQLVFADKHKRAFGHNIEERQQIRGGEVDAALRIRLAEVRFVAHAVDVNVTVVTVDCAALIKGWLKPAEPKNAIGDARVGVAFAVCADRFPAFENGADWFACADFFSDAMEAERGLEGIRLLARAVFGSGGGEFFSSVAVKMRERLRGHVDV